MTRTSDSPRRVYVGTYAKPGAEGLRRLDRDNAGRWILGSAHPEIRNASFAVHAPRHGLHYMVEEADAGAIGVYRGDADGWTQVAHVASHGSLPCYLALDAQQTRLAVANYDDGSVAVFTLDAQGLPGQPPDVRRCEGRGPVADRQDGAHAHCVCFAEDDRSLFHTDLGADRIYRHLTEPGGPLGETRIAYHAPAGSGPRHLVLHPILPLALLVSELASTLTVLQGPDLSYAGQTVSTLPNDFGGDSLAGQLSVNAAGDRVYVTNRGHDSVAVFAWDKAGRLTLLQHAPSKGASPRAFVLLEGERQMLLANEEGETITIYDVCADGTLAPRQTLALPGAAFPFVAA